MKRKEVLGFTLIELLAVIVILAIIALIAVPIVLNIINDSKKESIQRSIDLYIDTVQKRITQENMKVKYDPEECDIQNNGNVKCYVGDEAIKTSTGEEELKIEMNGKKPESGTITFKTSNAEGNNTNNNKITYSGVVLEGMEYTLKSDGTVVSTVYVPPTPATDEDYRGYYADVDGDGEADGIIYADLKQTVSGEWGTNGYGTYSYTAQTGLKEYTISKEKYTEGKFGEKEIISLKKGSSGTSRFYVMALEDFTTTDYQTFYWYNNASGKMTTYADDTKTDFGEGYNNTGKIIGIWNGGESGKYTAAQDNRDIFKHIQEKYNGKEKWYIPSKGEWAAFADYFTNNSKVETKLTTGNYNSIYGLSSWYWSSSQDNAFSACFAYFYGGYLDYYDVNRNRSVRLGATF